ncbi:MAG: TIGR04086 family membrane protein [Faecousia sp.]
MKRKGKKSTRGIVVQLVIAMPLLTILFALLSAKLILEQLVGEEYTGTCVCIYTALIAFVLCFYCAIRMPQKKILWGMLTAIAYLCLLLLSNLLFFGIGYGHILPVSACILGAGLIGSFLGAAKRRKYA